MYVDVYFVMEKFISKEEGERLIRFIAVGHWDVIEKLKDYQTLIRSALQADNHLQVAYQFEDLSRHVLELIGVPYTVQAEGRKKIFSHSLMTEEEFDLFIQNRLSDDHPLPAVCRIRQPERFWGWLKRTIRNEVLVYDEEEKEQSKLISIIENGGDLLHYVETSSEKHQKHYAPAIRKMVGIENTGFDNRRLNHPVRENGSTLLEMLNPEKADTDHFDVPLGNLARSESEQLNDYLEMLSILERRGFKKQATILLKAQEILVPGDIDYLTLANDFVKSGIIHKDEGFLYTDPESARTVVQTALKRARETYNAVFGKSRQAVPIDNLYVFRKDKPHEKKK